jgi:hypothetical protein
LPATPVESKALRCGLQIRESRGTWILRVPRRGLAVACRKCDAANQQADDRYCGGCGRLLADDAEALAERSRSTSSDSERRPVTVLFCDLVG